MKRVIFALGLFAFGVYFELLMVMKSFLLTTNWDQVEWGLSPDFHLNDIGFRFFALFQTEPGPIEALAPFANGGVGFLLVLTLSRAIYHRRRLDIIRRFFTISAILYAFRGITIVVTSLPDPFAGCDSFQVNLNEYSIFWLPFQKIGEAFQGGQLDCGDVFFSGHTATLTEMSMVWTLYTKNIPMKIFVWCVSGFTVFCMIGAYFHYTLDCMFGFLISITIWKTYHRLAKDPRVTEKHKWWGRYESESVGRSLAWIFKIGPLGWIRERIPFTPPRWLIYLDDDESEQGLLSETSSSTSPGSINGDPEGMLPYV